MWGAWVPCGSLSGWGRCVRQKEPAFAKKILQLMMLLSLKMLTLFKFYLGGSIGVGRIGLIDHDTVEVSNLHRQVMHTQSRVGVSKAVSLAASIAGINPSLQVKSIR